MLCKRTSTGVPSYASFLQLQLYHLQDELTRPFTLSIFFLTNFMLFIFLLSYLFYICIYYNILLVICIFDISYSINKNISQTTLK